MMRRKRQHLKYLNVPRSHRHSCIFIYLFILKASIVVFFHYNGLFYTQLVLGGVLLDGVNLGAFESFVVSTNQTKLSEKLLCITTEKAKSLRKGFFLPIKETHHAQKYLKFHTFIDFIL